VVFQNPQSLMDYGIYPRHPVQIYESLFYFALALLGLALLKKNARTGVVAFVLTIAMSLGRFFVEFIKEDQSVHTVGLYFNMGQILSLPMLLVGLGGLAFALNDRLKEPFGCRTS
jgi:prolipoprotein diacylglyceryltransferase